MLHRSMMTRPGRGARRGAAVLVMTVLAACNESPTAPRPAPEAINELPRSLSVAEREIITASNTFAFDLAHHVSEPDSNLFISPLSASMALAMTLNGAEERTFEQMRSMLGMDGVPLDEINASYHDLIQLLLGLDPSVEMAIGNSIWHRQGFPVHSSFLETVRAYFDAQVTALDFSDPGASKQINDWVADATNDRIQEIVRASIPADVMMYLINAIYFKGSWTARFDPAETEDADFHLDDGRTVRVPMMHLEKADVGRVTSETYDAIDLAYGARAFSMTIVVPRAGSDVETVLADLDAQGWATLIEGLTVHARGVEMPRFELEYERVLNSHLQALGMIDAFLPALADFDALTPAPDLYISEVKQKTFVAVNEEGTEAAAVTSVEAGLTSGAQPGRFRVDRPFLFAIRERLSGTILFLGKVADPTAA